MFASLSVQTQLPEMHNTASLLQTNELGGNTKPLQPKLFMKKENKMMFHRIIPISALNPLTARPPRHAIPNPVIHSFVESPKRKAVDLTPTFRSSSLSWMPRLQNILRHYKNFNCIALNKIFKWRIPSSLWHCTFCFITWLLQVPYLKEYNKPVKRQKVRKAKN